MNTSGNPNQKAYRSGLVTITGEANAGKSTLLNALLKTKIAIVSPRPQTTRNRILGVKHGSDYQILFIDTPGFVQQKAKSELSRFVTNEASRAAAEGDVCLLVVDVFHAARKAGHIEELKEQYSEKISRHPSLIALNKIDLIPKSDILLLIDEIFRSFIEQEGNDCEIIPVSALRNDGIELLEREIVKLLPEGPSYFPQEVLTDQSEMFLVSEIIREKVFCRLRDELPYSSAVTVEGWEEDKGLLRISATISVERKSQKGIVIGKDGSMLKSIGQAARVELEKIFATKVFLELFVRVLPNWSRTAKGLRRAGYS